MANATVWSGSAGNTLNSSVSINDTRRKFNFGERVAELAPMQSPFFVYLSKVAKKATNDPVFKFLEQRHQWQRRNFAVENTDAHTLAANTVAEGNPTALDLTCGYDKYGKITGSDTAPEYLLIGQVVVIKCTINATGAASDEAARATVKVTGLGAGTATGQAIAGTILSLNKAD